MMKSSGRTKGGRKRPAHLIQVVIAFIGWILSPLTPWNDAFVNIPISIAIAEALEFCCQTDFKIGYWIGYVTTNLMGLILIVLASESSIKDRIDLKSLLSSIVIALIVYIVLTFLGFS